jgi:hypothetical protein
MTVPTMVTKSATDLCTLANFGGFLGLFTIQATQTKAHATKTWR